MLLPPNARSRIAGRERRPLGARLPRVGSKPERPQNANSESPSRFSSTASQPRGDSKRRDEEVVGNEHLSSQETIELFKQYVIPNYNRFPVALVRGENSYVWDSEGNRYLDFFPGWGCNLLGHCPAPVVEAVCDQMKRLIHAPNTWYMEEQGLWAKALSERSFGGQAFFCNSGTEANEAAIKLVRLHAKRPRYKIITFEGGFHGRTFGSTTATAQPKYHEGLGPLMAGFVYAPYGDLDALAKLIDHETAALMIEPIQGEGGVRVPPDGFLAGLRKLADDNGLLLVFDEVQTGCGRTGHWFAYQHFGVTPDIMTLAKATCGGLAGAAMLCKKEIAPSLRPGMHAATFGGNPVAARGALASIAMVESQNLLERAQKIGEIFKSRLLDLQKKCDLIREVRGVGLMVGAELTIEGAATVRGCMDRKLLINCTHGNVIRLLPAMTLEDQQVHDGCDILGEVLTAQAG
jgi:predicted acetylornithine/succinylornithine family transaminase